ncbi:hypothetical protein C0J52_20639 [Blattella germanica]|nr:hypothetical protein C0J52_20639 [Blattella germanica]
MSILFKPETSQSQKQSTVVNRCTGTPKIFTYRQEHKEEGKQSENFYNARWFCDSNEIVGSLALCRVSITNLDKHFYIKWECKELEHPSYSPNISPGDFDFTRKAKETVYDAIDDQIHAYHKDVSGRKLAEKGSPTDVFLTIWDPVVMDNILFQTNLYMNQKQRRVKAVTLTELNSFLGLVLIWVPSTSEMPIAPRAMPQDRYLQILSNLHVNDNDVTPTDNKDKLYKLRPLISKLNENFKLLKLPDEVQSTDESMVQFKGCSSIKQCNTMKLDNKCVHLLSNFHGNETCTLSQKEKDHSGRDVSSPKKVQDYNKSMGGMDKADVLQAMYNRDRRSKKWWHRMFFALLLL